MKLSDIFESLPKYGSITIYRGENSSNRGGFFYSVDKEFAKQFTQSGRDSEVRERWIKRSDIFEPNPKVYAGNESGFDKAMEDAKELGRKAVRFSEGDDEPDSIYVFDKSALSISGSR